jgi:hypothetical protein
MTALCPNCTLPLEADHDTGTCKLIARECDLAISGKGDKLSRQILDLVQRLASRPNPRTCRGRSTRAAYLEFLAHFVKLARKGKRL